MRSARVTLFRHCRSATAAVEFALIAPSFLLFLFGMIVFGSYIAVINELQEIAAEAVRASIAGLSDAERSSLAQKAVTAQVGAYPFVDPTRIALVSAATDAPTQVFTITVRYDASGMFLFKMPFIAAPNKVIVRSASIQRGGL